MKKLNNKGFSLVELIIVIAIMAILVGVVGTQVIPYLEKSRQGKDMQVFSAWNTAGMSAYSMNADKANASKKVTITILDGSVTVVNSDGSGANSATASGATDGEKAIWSTFTELTNLGSNNFDSLVSREGKAIKTNSGKVVIEIPEGSASSIVTTIYKNASDKSDVFAPIENK